MLNEGRYNIDCHPRIENTRRRYCESKWGFSIVDFSRDSSTKCSIIWSIAGLLSWRMNSLMFMKIRKKIEFNARSTGLFGLPSGIKRLLRGSGNMVICSASHGRYQLRSEEIIDVAEKATVSSLWRSLPDDRKMDRIEGSTTGKEAPTGRRAVATTLSACSTIS